MAKPSKEHGRITGRQFERGPLVLSNMAMDAVENAYAGLYRIGINVPRGFIEQQIANGAADYMATSAMDDLGPLAPLTAGLTTPSIVTPIQFLQNWLPGFVRVITAARKADQILGMSTTGAWDDEEIVQGILEPLGYAIPYTDYGNVPLSSWNTNFERRTVLRFEQGMQVGVLEEARSARIRVSTANEKRSAAALMLEIQRNRIAFIGYNGGNNRTYGLLNDPSQGAYITAPQGSGGSTEWADKTFLEITADIRLMAATLQTQSMDTINPEDVDITFVVATAVYQYLSVTNELGTQSVKAWISETYPRMRVMSAPELNGANGNANVAYMFAESVEDGSSDDSRTWIQVVPAKFMALGVEKNVKNYVEDYTNATAGAMLKRPYAQVRITGI